MPIVRVNDNGTWLDLIPGGASAEQAAAISLVSPPGRIDAKARGLSTVAADNSTLLNALIVEAAATGAELWIPDGVYNATATGVSNLTIRGTGTIKGVTVGQSPLTFAAGVSNVLIEGITIDASVSEHHILKIQGSLASPTHHVTVRDVKLKNGGALGTIGWGLYFYAGGYHDILVDNVEVDNARGGCIIDRTRRTTIRRVIGTNLRDSNLVSVWSTNTAPSFLMDDVVVEDCHGYDLPRMCVEFYESNGGKYIRPVIRNNYGEWDYDNVPPLANNRFGISTPGSVGARVLFNRLVRKNAITRAAPETDLNGYGLELIGHQHEAIGNYVEGFAEGAIINAGDDQRYFFNEFVKCGLGLRGTTTNKRAQVCFNKFHDWVTEGLSLTSNDGAVCYNEFRRELTWAGDAARNVYCMSHTASADPPQRIVGNDYILAQATPSMLTFNCLRQTGTAGTNRTTVEKCNFVSESTVPFGRAIIANSGISSVTGYAYIDNYFKNLENIFQTAVTSGVNGQGNINNACTTANVGAAFFSPRWSNLSTTATLDFGSIAAGATATLTITVTGALVGDAVYLGPPSTLEAGLMATAFVSASNTVTVRLGNMTASPVDPASATWRASVLRAI
jgi:hypothetical protein